VYEYLSLELYMSVRVELVALAFSKIRVVGISFPDLAFKLIVYSSVEIK